MFLALFSFQGTIYHSLESRFTLVMLSLQSFGIVSHKISEINTFF
jgi:hypothetical protein